MVLQWFFAVFAAIERSFSALSASSVALGFFKGDEVIILIYNFWVGTKPNGDFAVAPFLTKDTGIFSFNCSSCDPLFTFYRVYRTPHY